MTRTDFVIYVLRRRMGVLGEQESPTSEDSETILQALDLYYAELSERSLANWSNTSVPDRLAAPLGAMAEARIWNLYMPNSLSAVEQMQAEQAAEAQLLAVIKRGQINAPVEIESF